MNTTTAAPTEAPAGTPPAENKPTAYDMRLDSARQVQGSQPVGIGQGAKNWFSNTISYIGKHPIEFALSTAASIAMRFAVTGGLLAISGGLPLIAVSIAASMITSVIIEVGKKAIKGEEINGKDVLKNALFAGAFAGVLGSLIGSLFDTPKLEVNTMEAAADPSVAHVGDVAEGYEHKITSIEDLQHRFGSAGQEYVTIEYGDTYTAEDLLAQDAEWIVRLNENGEPFRAISTCKLEEFLARKDELFAAHGLEEYSQGVIIKNSALPGAGVMPITFGNPEGLGLSTNVTFIDSELLTLDKGQIDFAIEHEIGHVEHKMHHYEAFKEASHHEKEFYADMFAVQNDAHYANGVEFFTDRVHEGIIDLDNGGDHHPSPRARITRFIEEAAKDPNFDPHERAEFLSTLKECQTKLTTAELIQLEGGTLVLRENNMDLVKIWEEARIEAIKNHDIHLTPLTVESATEMANEAKPGFSWVDYLKQRQNPSLATTQGM